MEEKDSPQKVIDNFQRRQQFTPFIVGGLAILFIMIGVIILIVWLAGPNRPAFSLFASATPTPTETFTSTITPSPTETETITPIPTQTSTATGTNTPSGPFEYVVQQGEYCAMLADRFKADLNVLMAINNFTNGCPVHPNQKILIPAPGQKMPTDTPLPTDFVRGTKITYTIQPGDTFTAIASKFNANINDIIKDNKITNLNKIFAGDQIIVKPNMVTPTKTMAPTSTPAPTKTGNSSAATATPAK